MKAGGVLDQPFEPRQFVAEFGTRLRVAVRQIQGADDHPVDRSFEIATVCVGFAAGKSTPALEWVNPFGENGYAVPRCLPMPYGSVTRRLNLLDRECRVGRLQFLQADDIRPFAL